MWVRHKLHDLKPSLKILKHLYNSQFIMEAQYWVQCVASLCDSLSRNYSYLKISSMLKISMILSCFSKTAFKILKLNI